MNFADYKGIWKVTTVDSGVNETVNHWIVIGGVSAAVKVLCLHDTHNHTFPPFSYDGEKLVSPDSSSTITLKPSTNEASNRIIWQGPLLPGSWTAEDNPGGLGGRKAE